MDIKTIRLIRDSYRNLLAQDPKYNPILFSLADKNDMEPILHVTEIEPESDLSYNEEQRQLSEILLDMHSINHAITEVKNQIDADITMLDNTITNIQDSISKQKEQIDDLNMICGEESVYNMTVPIYITDFPECNAETLDAKTIGAAINSTESVQYNIISVSGNGYSGNAFVYRDGAFENETDDRSDLNYIMDQSDTTVYEYSRLCARKKQDITNTFLNYDDRPVQCTLTLEAAKRVCKAKISIADEHVAVVRLETSDDGIQYVDRLSSPIYINDLSKIYNDATYVYGSKILCFPYASYVRITLINDEPTNDRLVETVNENLHIMNNVYRKKISIAGIELYRSSYSTADLVSQEILEDGNVDKISLFASEYIPDHFLQNDYVQYALLINGQEYKIVPVNSNKEGTRMIKCADNAIIADGSVQLINETIKSVKLKISIHTFNQDETPYVSNLKLCMGKNTGNIYV